MNPINIYRKFYRNFEHLQFRLDEGSNEEKAVFHTEMQVKAAGEDKIYVQCVVHNEGSAHMFFTFDLLEPTLENLLLINELNINTSFMKAYINKADDRYFFEIHYSASGMQNEDQVVEQLNNFLANLVSDVNIPKIKKILERTVAL